MGDKFVDDLRLELSKSELQLRVLNQTISKVDRQLGRAERRVERAYRKNAKATRGMRWLERYFKRLIKLHRLQREYDDLVRQRSSLREEAAPLREVIDSLPDRGMTGCSSQYG